MTIKILIYGYTCLFFGIALGLAYARTQGWRIGNPDDKPTPKPGIQALVDWRDRWTGTKGPATDHDLGQSLDDWTPNSTPTIGVDMGKGPSVSKWFLVDKNGSRLCRESWNELWFDTEDEAQAWIDARDKEAGRSIERGPNPYSPKLMPLVHGSTA